MSVGIRKLLRAVGLAAVALALGLLPTTHAQAAPSVEEIEAQITASWEKLEPIIEQYNNIHNQLVKNKAKSTELAKKIQPLQLQVDLALSRIGEIAAKYYKGGTASAMNAILTSGSPTTLANQLTLLDQIAKAQQRQIANVSVTKSKYDGEKQKLDELIAAQAKQDTELAAKKKTIQAEIDRLQRLRVQAYGTTSVGGSLRLGTCAPPSTASAKRAAVIRFACSQIGKPYGWGSNGPNSYDCSGLTQAAWAKGGVSLAHYTGDQWSQTRAGSGTPGDLIFFYRDLHHVGLYLGNGMMVHAPHSGDVVRMAYTANREFAGYRSPG